jgi:hypothetical protein
MTTVMSIAMAWLEATQIQHLVTCLPPLHVAMAMMVVATAAMAAAAAETTETETMAGVAAGIQAQVGSRA